MDTRFGDVSKMPKTRNEAIASGDRKYFTGVLCKNEHIAPRYTLNGGCLACMRPMLKVKFAQARNVFHLTPVILSGGRSPTPEMVSFFNGKLMSATEEWVKEFDLTTPKLGPATLENIKLTEMGHRGGGLPALLKAGWTPDLLVIHGMAVRLTWKELHELEAVQLQQLAQTLEYDDED